MKTSRPLVTFSTTHRVEVRVPEGVFRKFGHTWEYAQASYSASEMVQVSGQDAYGSVVEWGESHSAEEVADFGAYWHNKVLGWQRELRDQVD